MFLALVFSLLILAGCKKETDNDVEVVAGEVEETDEVVESEGVPVTDEDITLPREPGNFDFEKAGVVVSAHKKYLSDELKFVPVPTEDIKHDRTAVVGSHECKFYPYVELKTQEDLAKLKNGVPIPFATVIPIEGEPIEAPYNEELCHAFFIFEKNQNYFYKTTWNGKEGLVFGADLTNIRGRSKYNRITSLLYKTKGFYKEFYPLAGYDYLDEANKQTLERDRLSFQSVTKSEYYLSSETPDDMIALYQRLSEFTPQFITTDLMAHSRHLVFDRTLQYIEEKFFIPALDLLVDGFLAGLEKVNTSGNASANDETLEKAVQYFQVAKALIELAPNTEENENTGRLDYKDVDYETVVSKYPDVVQKEVKKIYDAGGLEQSVLFTFADGSFTKEDYTQYKPRGHYTKNGVLEAYFRAMMWFGRAHFMIAQSGSAPLAKDGSAGSDTEKLTYNMEPIALLITEVVKADVELYKAWEKLFNPITNLIGISDDLSFKEIIPLWNSYEVKNFKKWSSKKENLLKFMEDAHEKLRPPAIAGNSLLYVASEGDALSEKKPPMGWRLFGQRFTFDSYIYGLVTAPRLGDRINVSGLDIIKAFGSKSADYFLSEEYKTFPKLKGILEKVQSEIEKSPEATFGKTYYGSVLNEVALQARFEQGSGFYFTESPAWNIKTLLSSHGTWAELKHDTILYAKQNYAERGGGGDSPTFRTEPVPRPIHYIEPNLPFWKNASVSVELLLTTLQADGLIDDVISGQLKTLKEICDNIIKIVELEIEDKPISDYDNDYITTIPSLLAKIVLIGMNIEDSFEQDELAMPIVADVFTNSEEGTVLEVGVGIPYRLFVPLNDGQGGKRIAVGYCFNYYEFYQPMNERLNDEQWKKMVFEKGVPEDKKPAWARDIALPAVKDE
ncbi:MAG: hypothetical protein CR988_01470 [Treponema sp.]|nr:MAG: hypothetical protein CR988_01470 [Treponema sp.]